MAMEISDIILNKVAESGLVTLDLKLFYPQETIKVFRFERIFVSWVDYKRKRISRSIKKLLIGSNSQMQMLQLHALQMLLFRFGLICL